MSIGRRSKKVKALAAASALIAVCSVFTGLLSADTTVLISLTTQTSTVNPGDIINFNVNCDTFDYVSEFGPIDVVYDADQFEFVSVTYADVLSGYAFEYDTSEAGTVSVTADFIEVTDEETGLDVDPFHSEVETLLFQVSLRARSDASGDTSVRISSTGTFTRGDGTVIGSYSAEPVTVSIAHGVSTDATLSALSIEGITMTPPFDPQVFEYSATVSRDVESVSVNAVPTNLQASVSVDGADELSSGENIVSVRVLAQDGIRWREYRIFVNRQENYIPEGSGFIDSQGVTFTFMTFPSNLVIPEGFIQTMRTINGYSVPVFAKDGVVSVLVYVYNGTDEPSLYFYNPISGVATVYRAEATVISVGRVLTTVEVPEDVHIPRGFEAGVYTVGDNEMEGYINDDGNFIAYMRDDTGNSSFYYYDPADEHFYEYKSVERTTERVYRNLFYLFLGLSVLQSGFIVVMTYLIRKVVNNRVNPRPKRV